MKRRALLIGAPGGNNSNFLKGVEADLYNIRKYLTSPQGGGWYNDEIITLENATIDQIESVFDELEADYTQIFFSGHGSTDQYGRRLLHLSNGDFFEDKEFLNLNSPLLLMVVDACRNYVPSSGLGSLGEAPYSSIDGYSGKLELARKKFDNWIRNSDPGRVIIYATDHLNSSLDLGTGGLFTSILLHCASKLTPKGNNFSAADIIFLTEITESFISKTRYSQRPRVVYREGNSKLLFALGVPEIKPVPKFIPVKKKSNAGEVLFWSLVTVGVIAAISNRD